MENNISINRELKEIEKERITNQEALKNERDRMRDMLINGMGEDIKNVLNGKTVVKLSWFERLKYKFNYYLNKIFNAI